MPCNTKGLVDFFGKSFEYSRYFNGVRNCEKTCLYIVCFGADDKAEMKAKFRNETATMRWETWEDFYEYTKVLLEEYLKLDVEFEKTTILRK